MELWKTETSATEAHRGVEERGGGDDETLLHSVTFALSRASAQRSTATKQSLRKRHREKRKHRECVVRGGGEWVCWRTIKAAGASNEEGKSDGTDRAVPGRRHDWGGDPELCPEQFMTSPG